MEIGKTADTPLFTSTESEQELQIHKEGAAQEQEQLSSEQQRYTEQTKMAQQEKEKELLQTKIGQESKEFQEAIIGTQEPLTFQLLYNTTTAESLKKVLADPSFAKYGETPNLRLKNILTEINNALSEYIHNQFRKEREKNPNFNQRIKPQLDKMIKQVIVPATERFLLESTKNFAQKPASSKSNLLEEGLTENVNQIVNLFQSVISGKVGNIKIMKQLMSAMNYLGEHQTEICNALAEGSSAAILENPVRFLEDYLKHPVRAGKRDLSKLPKEEVGLLFDQKTKENIAELQAPGANDLTVQEREEIKEKIGNITFQVAPEKIHETLSFVRNVEKSLHLGNRMEKDIFSLLDLLDKSNLNLIEALSKESPLKRLLSL